MYQGTRLNLSDIPAPRGQSGNVPATQADGAAISQISDRTDALEGATGWAVYAHGGGAQSLAAATRTQLSIDAATKNESQLPSDTGPLWDAVTDTITGRIGDAIVVKVQCIFTPDDATASMVLFDVDIGGLVGVVEYHSFTIGEGAGNPHYLSWTFSAYTLDTWEANGGAVHATSDGPGDITNLRIVVQRTHKART